MKGILLTTTCFAVLSASELALAIPKLQLDIAGGVYDARDETTMASANAFTLYALNNGLTITGDFYLSAALVPQTPRTPAPDLGSFKIAVDLNGNGLVDGTEAWVIIPVVGGMTYGTAPIEVQTALQGFDSGDLSKHGVFETYFTEFRFKFASGLTTAAYDVAEGTHPALTPSAAGEMVYQPFLVDVSGLEVGYGIHFDLYDEQLIASKKHGTDIDVEDFAPFSHDAAANSQAVRIPDGGNTAALLGVGLLVVGYLARRTMP